jgi:hypothetical protein
MKTNMPTLKPIKIMIRRRDRTVSQAEQVLLVHLNTTSLQIRSPDVASTHLFL